MMTTMTIIDGRDCTWLEFGDISWYCFDRNGMGLSEGGRSGWQWTEEHEIGRDRAPEASWWE